MKYEVIFCIFALVLTAGVVGAFAWALLGHSKGGRAEEARTADNLAGLREEYAHLVEQQAAGRLTQAALQSERKSLRFAYSRRLRKRRIPPIRRRCVRTRTMPARRSLRQRRLL